MNNYSQALLFLGMLVLFFSDCKKDENLLQAAKPTTDSDFYVKAMADNNAIRIRQNSLGYESGAGVTIETTDDHRYVVAQSMLFMNPLQQRNYMGVIIQRTVEGQRPSAETQETIVVPGIYEFGRRYSKNIGTSSDGVILFYVDQQGLEWASDAGSANQFGSRFEIQELKKNADKSSKSIATISFRCMVYTTMGDSMLLTNGEMRCRSVQVAD